MTPQRAVNRFYKHFIAGGGKPALENGSCTYETEDGDKCGVGILLSKAALQELRLRGKLKEPVGVILDIPKVEKSLEGLEYGFLLDLQLTHDCAAEGTFDRESDFKLAILEGLKELVKKYDLKMPRGEE